jgi:hypothetical protein
MVKVTEVAKRKASDGREFNVLILSADKPELVKSASGNQYMVVRTASIPCSADESMAKHFIGLELPGSITKVPCEAYSYTLQDGKQITLEHRFEYNEAATSIEESVFS